MGYARRSFIQIEMCVRQKKKQFKFEIKNNED